MKHLIYCFVAALLISTTSFAQKEDKEVGAFKNGHYVITANNNDLKKIFNQHLSNIKINITVKTIQIKKLTIANTRKKYYMLLAESADHTVKAAITLKLRDSVFIAAFANKTFEFICVCSGCDKGCIPQRTKEDNESVWMCSPCKNTQTDKTKKSECMKSETVTGPDKS